ncbi:MAG: divalent-cation tolerance protein CutA [Candidatus Odinarchaeia archaeon]
MCILVLITVGSQSEAEKISMKLIEEKAAACVNIVQKVDSIYYWKGKIEKSEEALLIIKTVKSMYKKLEEIVLSLHSYDNPEIIWFEIKGGSANYLKWIKEAIER